MAGTANEKHLPFLECNSFTARRHTGQPTIEIPKVPPSRLPRPGHGYPGVSQLFILHLFLSYLFPLTHQLLWFVLVWRDWMGPSLSPCLASKILQDTATYQFLYEALCNSAGHAIPELHVIFCLEGVRGFARSKHFRGSHTSHTLYMCSVIRCLLCWRYFISSVLSELISSWCISYVTRVDI